jgi:transcriptional regulator with XRE-family HTH domain
MKQIPSKIGLRLRELRQSRRQTQESLSLECRQRGFAITRTKLAKYEIGMTQVPACFIPVLAYVLKVDVTDLLPPINRRAEPRFVAEQTNKNLAGQRIRSFRKKRKWTQHGLASVFQKMGVPITREIIANVETQRSRVKDYQLILFAKALQVPLISLFPDGAGTTNSPNVLNNNPQSQNPLEARRRNGQFSPFTRMARKIGKFAKRLITRR